MSNQNGNVSCIQQMYYVWTFFALKLSNGKKMSEKRKQ